MVAVSEGGVCIFFPGLADIPYASMASKSKGNLRVHKAHQLWEKTEIALTALCIGGNLSCMAIDQLFDVMQIFPTVHNILWLLELD